MNRLTYGDICDIEESELPEHKKLVKQYWQEQHQELMAVEEQRQQLDREWASWITTPEAIAEILKTPDLAIKPSERRTKLQQMLDALKGK